MKFQACLNNYRSSAYKVRELSRVIKGLAAPAAMRQLENVAKPSALDVLKLLQSAVANAKNTYNVSEADLLVENLVINEGRRLKRWRARAFGRAAAIIKRTCHIIIVLETADKEQKLEKVKPPKKIEAKKEESETEAKDKKDQHGFGGAATEKGAIKTKPVATKGKIFHRKSV